MGEKNQKILHLMLLLLLMTPPPVESFIFTAIMTAVSFAYQAYNIINDAHDTYKKFAPQTTLDDVLDQAKKVEEKVDQIGAQLSNQISQAVDSIVTQVEDKANLRDGLKTLSQGIRRIDNLYRVFEMYTSKKIALSNYTLQDYIQQVTTFGAFSPKDVLNEIHDLIIPNTGFQESLIYYLQKNVPRDDTYTCGNGAPAQGTFYQIFRLIMVNEIRAFTMLAFSYSLNQALRCESYQGEIQMAEYDLRTRAMEYYDVFLEIAEESANSVRSCDPSGGWERGRDFRELEKFKTGYLVNIRGFFPLHGKCSGTCEDLKQPSTIKDCRPSFGCGSMDMCWGHLYNCTTMSDVPAKVCELSGESKRYEWYSNAATDKYGNDTNGCSETVREFNRKEGCDVCWCTCVEDSYKPNSLRTFSFREQLTDIGNNKVVTGVQFVVEENMVHIQIQQGVAVSEGRIAPGSIDWKPLERIFYDDNLSYLYERVEYFWLDDEEHDHNMTEFEDFLTFNWYSHRIFLDNLIVPPGYVLTGARFSTPVKIPGERNPLQLEIHATPFDYDSGKIVVTDDNPSIWLTPKDMVGASPAYDKEREEIHFNQLKDPEVEGGTFIPRSLPNSYLDMQRSSIVEDAGQSVIPYLDTQGVVGKPAFAAGGIGIYLKTATLDGSGFLGFRLYGLESMKNIPMHALDQMDKYSEGVTAFKGCNENL